MRERFLSETAHVQHDTADSRYREHQPIPNTTDTLTVYCCCCRTLPIFESCGAARPSPTTKAAVLDSCTVPVRLAILWTKSHSARANFVQYCEYAAVRYRI